MKLERCWFEGSGEMEKTEIITVGWDCIRTDSTALHLDVKPGLFY